MDPFEDVDDNGYRFVTEERPDLSTDPLNLKDHLAFVRAALLPLATKYPYLASMFQVGHRTITGIENSTTSSEERLTQILVQWFRQATADRPVTWKKVVFAIASDVGGDNYELACEVADRHLKFETVPQAAGVSEEKLTSKDNEFEVNTALTRGRLSAKLIPIGLCLGIPYDVLEGMNGIDNLTHEWLSGNHNKALFGQPSWKKLVEVIAMPAGGDNLHYALQLADKHKAKEGKKSEATPLPTSNGAKAPPNPPRTDVTTPAKPPPTKLETPANPEDVCKELYTIRTEWREVGRALGVSRDDLNEIERNQTFDTDKRRLEEVVYKWHDTTEGTVWSMVVKALRDIKKIHIASDIEKKH